MGWIAMTKKAKIIILNQL